MKSSRNAPDSAANHSTGVAAILRPLASVSSRHAYILIIVVVLGPFLAGRASHVAATATVVHGQEKGAGLKMAKCRVEYPGARWRAGAPVPIEVELGQRGASEATEPKSITFSLAPAKSASPELRSEHTFLASLDVSAEEHSALTSIGKVMKQRVDLASLAWSRRNSALSAHRTLFAEVPAGEYDFAVSVQDERGPTLCETKPRRVRILALAAEVFGDASTKTFSLPGSVLLCGSENEGSPDVLPALHQFARKTHNCDSRPRRSCTKQEELEIHERKLMRSDDAISHAR